MAGISEIKRRIQATKSIAKITNAMELVASAKLQRISKRIMVSKPYFAEIYTVFNTIIQQANKAKYQANAVNQEQPTAWIIVNSNLGLCGGYNSNLNKMVLAQYKTGDLLIVLGKKGQTFFQNHNLPITEFIEDISINFTYERAQGIGSELLSSYNNEKIGQIKIAYTKFINNLLFEPTILTLLPITKLATAAASEQPLVLMEFEPNADAILETALPFYLSSLIYSAIMESQLSEQGSRRNAMQNATNNAKDMIDHLSLEYNRQRQSSITQEILEIVAGANAQNN